MEESQREVSIDGVQEKKVQGTHVKTHLNAIPKFIRESISKLREKDMTYKQIGIELGMGAGQVHLLLSGKWYPQTREIENRIFEKLKSAPNNFKGEGKDE